MVLGYWDVLPQEGLEGLVHLVGFVVILVIEGKEAVPV